MIPKVWFRACVSRIPQRVLSINSPLPCLETRAGAGLLPSPGECLPALSRILPKAETMESKDVKHSLSDNRWCSLLEVPVNACWHCGQEEGSRLLHPACRHVPGSGDRLSLKPFAGIRMRSSGQARGRKAGQCDGRLITPISESPVQLLHTPSAFHTM